MNGPAVCAAGLMMNLPFLLPVHRLPIPSFEAEWLAAAFGLLCLLAACVFGRRLPLAVPAVALAPLALGAVVAVQAAAGLPAATADAVVVGGYLAFTAALMTAGHNLARARGLASLYGALAWALLAGGLASSLAGFAQYADLAPLAPALLYPAEPAAAGIGVYGNVAQQNHFATYTALALAATLFLFRQGRLPRWPAAGAALLLTGALALSGSRSSLLYLGCIGFAWLWTSADAAAHVHRPPWRRPLAGATLLLAAGAALALLLWFAAQHGLLGPRLARLVAYGEGIGPRTWLWRQAWRIIAAHPWAGVGIDRFAAALVDQLRPDERLFGVDQYAHNLALQLLAGCGIAGLLAVAVPLAAFVRRAARARRGADAMLAWALLAILFVHSMLEQPLYYTYFLAIAAFAAGTLDGKAWSAPGHAARRTAGAAAGAGLLLLAVAGSDYGRLTAEFYGDQAGDPFDAWHTALLLSLHRDPLFRPLTELIGPGSFVPADAPVADRLAFNTRVLGYAPIAEVVFRQAALLAEAGQLDAATRQFRQAALAYPDDVAAYVARIDDLAARDPARFAPLSASAHALAPRPAP